MSKDLLTISRSILFAVCGALLMSACSTAIVRDSGLDKLAPRKAEQELSAGLKSYEDGNYVQAQKQIQNALNNDLTFKKDRVTAHKYLAFIYCADGRMGPCRDEFRAALDIDPSMQLAPAEAGHPVWGPVFRSVKAGR